MRPTAPCVAALVLGLASAASMAAAPAPAFAQPDPARCLLTAAAATPRATPATRTVATPAADPSWRTMPLKDVCSGETFTLAQFAPKAVFVHPMATW